MVVPLKFKVCDILTWDVSFGRNCGSSTVKIFLIDRLKATIFPNRGTPDVKPVSLIWRILWRSAGPYSGPSQLPEKVQYAFFVELSLEQ
jgi:hypothetical protein